MRKWKKGGEARRKRMIVRMGGEEEGPRKDDRIAATSGQAKKKNKWEAKGKRTRNAKMKTKKDKSKEEGTENSPSQFQIRFFYPSCSRPLLLLPHCPALPIPSTPISHPPKALPPSSSAASPIIPSPRWRSVRSRRRREMMGEGLDTDVVRGLGCGCGLLGT